MIRLHLPLIHHRILSLQPLKMNPIKHPQTGRMRKQG